MAERTNVTDRIRGKAVFDSIEVKEGRIKSVKRATGGAVSYTAAATATVSVTATSTKSTISTSATIGVTTGEGRNFIKGVFSVVHTGTKKLKATASLKTIAGTKSLAKLSTAAATKTTAFTKTLPFKTPGTIVLKGAPTSGTMPITVKVKTISVNALTTLLS